MPFLAFPNPGGSYAVGQCDALWKDDTGKKLMVRIFYPVDKDSTVGLQNAAWLPETYGAKTISYAEAYAKFMWRPGINASLIGTLGFWPLMSNVKTQTWKDAPVCESLPKFRPIVYSHGLGGSRSCYSAVCVDLASHGYFVVALEHTDGSACLSVHSDGTVFEHSFVPPLAIIPVKQRRIPGGFTKSLIPRSQPQPMTQYEFRNKQLIKRAAEMSFAADCLEKLSEGKDPDLVALPPALAERVVGRLDMGRLSAVGHSFGASTCLTACHQDQRFRACVAHDAWLFPLSESVATGALRVPTLFLNADTFEMLWPEEGNKLLYSLTRRSRANKVSVRAFGVNGTKHQNYSDFPVIAPELTGAMGVRGSTDADDALRTINACGASFLDFHLAPDAPAPGPGPDAGPVDWIVPKELEAHVTPYDAARWGAAGLGLDEEGGGAAEEGVRVKIGAFTNDKSYVPPSIDKV